MLLGLIMLAGSGPSQSAPSLSVDSTQTEEAFYAGTTEGEFQVNGNGGANYTIPIEVPPGRNGIEPQLSLQYNSQQGNGLLGVGWSLTGLSAIARCPKTIAQDGAVGGIDFHFDNDDRFCLDGQRLVAISGQYGENGTEYRTERESWMKIVSHERYGNGPKYFTAVAKDGSRLEFGNTSDSRIEVGNKTSIRVWSVNKVTDRNGNYLTAAYTKPETDHIRDGDYYPYEIQYTGHTNGHSPQRKVQFYYEARDDKSENYIAGFIVKNASRLKMIKTVVMENGNESLVKKYRLGYEYGQATGRSRLKTVHECDDESHCFPATRFEWGNNGDTAKFLPGVPSDMGDWTDIDANNAHQFYPMDVNGDGIADFVELYECPRTDPYRRTCVKSWMSGGEGVFTQGKADQPIGGWVNFNSPEANRFYIMDVNGDGLNDIVVVYKDDLGATVTSWMSNGDGTFQRSFGFDQIGPWKDINAADAHRYYSMDVNGDGLSDLVELYECPQTDPYRRTCVKSWMSGGEGVFTQGKADQPIGGWADFNSPEANRFYIMDVNGDSLNDIVVIYKDDQGATITSWMSNGDGTFQRSFGFDQIGPWKDINAADAPRYYPMDVNGDGNTDFVELYECPHDQPRKTCLKSWISKGEGVFTQGKTSWQVGDWVDFNSSKANRFYIMDVNGDGLSDLVMVFANDNDSAESRSWISDGIGNFSRGPESVLGSFTSLDSPSAERYYPMDVTGDGISDLVDLAKCSDQNNRARTCAYSWITDSHPESDFISSITDGLGSQTEVEYKPITDSSIYTKGTGAAYPVVDVQEPIYVVSRHTVKENGSNPSNIFNFDHKYKTARTNLTRGWQGFEKTILVDPQNKTETTTTHLIDFPLSGMIANRTITDQSNTPKILGVTTWDYGWEKDQAIQGSYVYKIWLDNTTTDHYTLGTFNYTLGTVYTYDPDYRNVTQVWHQGDRSETEEEDDFYTCTRYYSGEGDDWWKNTFPIATKQVRTMTACNNWQSWDSTNDLSWQQFHYDENSMNLTSQQVWDDSKRKQIETQIGYDPYGNVTRVTDALGHTSNITYESTYKTFPATRTTPGTDNAPHGLTVTTEFEPKFGIKTKVVDANGVTLMKVDTEKGLDGMGRITQIKSPDSNGKTHTVSLTEFSSGNNGAGMKTTTYHRASWGDDGKPLNTWLWTDEYTDGLGRTTKTISPGYESGVDLISNEVEFNARGQVENSYLPYYVRTSDNCIHVEPDGQHCVSKQYNFHEYDIHGRLHKTTAPTGAIEEYDYNLDDDRQVITKTPDPTQLEDGEDQVDWTEHYTSRGRVEKRIAPDGSTEMYEYDRLGRLLKVTDPLGQTSTTTYNSLGQVTSATQVDQGTTTYTYNDNGNLETRIDAKKQKIKFTYDALGRIRSKEVYKNENDASPIYTTNYTYDDPGKSYSNGRLTRIDSPKITREFAYDAMGNVRETKVLLDIDGDGTKGTDGNAEETLISRSTYDAVKRIDKITYPDNSEVLYTYRSVDGTLESLKFRSSEGSSRSTYATYDPLTALGAQSRVQYGTAHNTEKNMVSEFHYAPFGRLTANSLKPAAPEEAPAIRNFNYRWNRANKLLEIIDFTNQGIGQSFQNPSNSAYDSRGRLLQARSEFYGDRDYAYDATGNLTRQSPYWYVTDPDKKNQLQTVCSIQPTNGTCPQNKIQETITYDDNGNMSTRVAGTDTTNYTYDAENRLIEIKKNNVLVNTFTYDSGADRISKTDYDETGTKTLTSFYPFSLYEIVKPNSGNGVHTKYLLGPEGQVAAISVKSSQSLDSWLAYNTGTLLASMSNPLGSVDGFVQYFSGKIAQFSFYPFAHEALKTGLGFGYLALVFTGFPYIFVRSSGRIRRFALRRLRNIGVIQKQTAEHEPSTGGEKKPLRMWTSFFALLFSINGLVLAPTLGFAEMAPGGNGPGVPVAGNTLFFHHNPLGSNTVIINQEDETKTQVYYDPHGQMIQSKNTGIDNFRPKFTDKEWDSASELNYFGARYYDPQLGRFLTPDPAGQFHSPYMYGSGDPLTGVDPDGRFFIQLAIITVGLLVGAYLGGAAMNHSGNPATWNWSSGKTWAGMIVGAVIGGLTSGAGLAATAGVTTGVAAAGLTGMAANAVTIATGALALGAIGGTANVAFSAIGGASGSDLGKSFLMGFMAGLVLSIPVIGEMSLAGMGGYDTYQLAINPSVENGIALGLDILFLGMTATESFGGGRGEGGGCSSSFTEDTTVATENGMKNIEDIKEGDKVWSYNEETEENELKPVKNIFSRVAAALTILALGTTSVEATPEHPFHVPGKGWVEARDLKTGDEIKQLDGTVAVVQGTSQRNGLVRVYNFEVEDTHNYYVSDKEVLVHNVCKRQTRSRTRRARRSNVDEVNLLPDSARRIRKAPPRNTRDRRHPDYLFMPGNYAAEHVPASGYTVSRAESERIQVLAERHGCHSCGRKPQPDEVYVGDHQRVSALIDGYGLRLYPQCPACSSRQGGLTIRILRRLSPSPPGYPPIQ